MAYPIKEKCLLPVQVRWKTAKYGVRFDHRVFCLTRASQTKAKVFQECSDRTEKVAPGQALGAPGRRPSEGRTRQMAGISSRMRRQGNGDRGMPRGVTTCRSCACKGVVPRTRSLHRPRRTQASGLRHTRAPSSRSCACKGVVPRSRSPHRPQITHATRLLHTRAPSNQQATATCRQPPLTPRWRYSQSPPLMASRKTGASFAPLIRAASKQPRCSELLQQVPQALPHRVPFADVDPPSVSRALAE